MYMPWLEMALEQRERLPAVVGRSRGGGAKAAPPSVVDSQLGGSNSLLSATSCPQPGKGSHRNTLHLESFSPFALHSKDSVSFSAIAAQGSEKFYNEISTS